MATMGTRRLGWTIAAVAALLAVRPVGPLERLADLTQTWEFVPEPSEAS